jgi:tRNA (adenine-N(1)-)-methyltransferase non-catalytic subunit
METSLGMLLLEIYSQHFKLVVPDEVISLEDLFMNGEGGEDNRDLKDEMSSQKLSKKDITSMREDGVAGHEIVEKLIENSETFQQKTKFSQAKFLKKKAKKYHHYIMVRRPSIRLLMELHYKADPMKLMNLRVDSLAQILHSVNVHSGGRYLVYETGAQGIVVAAMLDWLGSRGGLTHVYQTGQPQTNCLAAMDFSPAVLANLRVVNIQHLRSLQQGVDILAAHPRTDGGPPPRKRAREGEAPTAVQAEASVDQPARMGLREQSVAAHRELQAGGPCDGLVIVCKQHPAALLTYLTKFLGPSRPFAVYSPYKEPLLEAYMAVKEAGTAINCSLSETWLRQHQVLPDRTHPMVTMSGGGGYLLAGIHVTG